MGTIITWILAIGLIAAWSYLCARVGVAVAAASVNSMIRSGKIIVRA